MDDAAAGSPLHTFQVAKREHDDVAAWEGVMNCFNNCFFRLDTGAAIFVGAIVGGMVGGLFIIIVPFVVACIAAGGSVAVVLLPGAPLACIGAGAAMAGFVITTGVGLAVAAISMAIGATVGLIARIAWCAATCQGNAGGASGVAPAIDAGALIDAAGATACQQAQDLLAEAQRQLDRAAAAVDAQQREVDRLRRRRNAFAAAVTAGLAAAAAALPWNPVAAAAALAAAAVAAVALAAAEISLNAARAALAVAQTAIPSLQTAVNSAKALVDRLCPPARSPSGPPQGGLNPARPGGASIGT